MKGSAHGVVKAGVDVVKDDGRIGKHALTRAVPVERAVVRAIKKQAARTPSGGQPGARLIRAPGAVEGGGKHHAPGPLHGAS